eukprot:scaffold1224_cov97-Cylindrotheca_fusiformis.AAC.1
MAAAYRLTSTTRKNPVNLALEELVTSFIPFSVNEKNSRSIANHGGCVSQWWWEPEQFRDFLMNNDVRKDLSLKTVEQSLENLSKLSIKTL